MRLRRTGARERRVCAGGRQGAGAGAFVVAAVGLVRMMCELLPLMHLPLVCGDVLEGGRLR